MQKLVLALVALVVVSAAFDAQALKRQQKPGGALPVTAPVAQQAVTKSVTLAPVVLAKQVNMTDAEKNRIRAEVKKAHDILVQMALSRGNIDDALTFYEEVDQFVEDYTNELDEAAKVFVAGKLAPGRPL